MSVNVNVGFSRKVGEPNEGSRGASVHLEVELDGAALNDPDISFCSTTERLDPRSPLDKMKH
jgi:hypothetical protein